MPAEPGKGLAVPRLSLPREARWKLAAVVVVVVVVVVGPQQLLAPLVAGVAEVRGRSMAPQSTPDLTSWTEVAVRIPLETMGWMSWAFRLWSEAVRRCTHNWSSHSPCS